ncbi:hypothetical protein GUITHDRAFT_151661 [Guillardia theta CCMP2712]|uniref:Uncharacterized protein n=1 Tax=Guillardia theta (strain CCMP2712) TaxID=905079 RepID=L1JJM2_GUITC|nr:hypothetical protein GUITHDRAFT_151661 [Guillardia theta CCMP2712]EKX48701.1 hypothetical protein GUITHDRAFT_151661 [Guillardia theta CCMP2712]|eukprot:XP_005835681.1 hypothetical protein GUITHDRAFT_151661 [Guillardia theta CCMP2712]
MGACTSRIDEKVATILRELDTIKFHCPEHANDLDWENEESVLIHSCINTLKNCAMHNELKKKKKSWIKKTKSLSPIKRNASPEHKTTVAFHEGYTVINRDDHECAGRDDMEDLIIDELLENVKVGSGKSKLLRLSDALPVLQDDSIRAVVLHGSALDILLRTQTCD